jgi:hypothetical protein
VKVSLVSGNKVLTCYAMIDSGADYCVFPRSFMLSLGIDPLTSPMEMTAGVGTEGVPTHFANISIDLQGLIRFPVLAGFTAGLDPLALGLLGQVGFFDRFNLEFRLSEKICLIEIPDRSV